MFRQALSGARLAATRCSAVSQPGGAAPRGLLARPWAQARFFADRSGVVKFFNAEKGFGFIESEGQDYFVHYTGIESQGFKSLADGEEVDFDMEVDNRTGKQRAVRVTGPGGAPVKGSQRDQGGY